MLNVTLGWMTFVKPLERRDLPWHGARRGEFPRGLHKPRWLPRRGASRLHLACVVQRHVVGAGDRHSGNTEETVAAEAALKMDATVVVIATGGVLAGLPELFPRCHLIPTVGGQPPRTAFGHISRQVAVMNTSVCSHRSRQEEPVMIEHSEKTTAISVLAQPKATSPCSPRR